MARLLAFAVAAASLAVSSVSGRIGTGQLYVDTFLETGSNVQGQAWSLQLNTISSGVVTASQVAAATRPAFPMPKDRDSLRRDNSFYVPALETIYSLHPSAPHDGDEGENAEVAPFSEFWGYSLFQGRSTYIMPVAGYSVTCSAFDPNLNVVLALSSVWQDDAKAWNVTLMNLEYNGDFYSYRNTAWTEMMDDAPGSPEDACRPMCAHDSVHGLFSFHWPTSTGGQLYTLNITVVDFAPKGSIVARVNWPLVVSGSTPPEILGLVMTEETEPRLAYVGKMQLDAASAYTTHYGTIDQITGADTQPPTIAPELMEYAAPRIAALGYNVILTEYVAPFRVAFIDLVKGPIVEAKISFQGAPDITKIQVIGTHSQE